MEKFLGSNLFKNCLMPLIIVFITLYFQRRPEKEKERQEIRIKSFLLFMDIDMKIKSMQMALKDNLKYAVPNNSLNYKQINDLLISISKELTTDDINIINMFYYNHNSIEKAVEKRKKEETSIKLELYKVAFAYKHIYINNSMADCYNKLYKMSAMTDNEINYNKADLNLDLEKEVDKAMEIVEETFTI